MKRPRERQKSVRLQTLLEALVAIQILCARGASLEQIHETAEHAITCSSARH